MQDYMRNSPLSNNSLWLIVPKVKVYSQGGCLSPCLCKCCVVCPNRRTDSRLQGLVLCWHLLGLTELLPVHQRQKYMQNCERLLLGDSQAFQHVEQTLGNMGGQEALPKELLCLLLASLHYFSDEVENKKNLPEAARRGRLWVSLGLLQIQTWLPQARFDPAVKKAYKLKYAQEEVRARWRAWAGLPWLTEFAYTYSFVPYKAV